MTHSQESRRKLDMEEATGLTLDDDRLPRLLLLDPYTGVNLFHYVRNTATRCNTLRHTATRCNTLQHAATRCNTLQQSGDAG